MEGYRKDIPYVGEDQRTILERSMTDWLWLLERSAGDLNLRRKIYDQPSKSRVYSNHIQEDDVGEHD